MQIFLLADVIRGLWSALHLTSLLGGSLNRKIENNPESERVDACIWVYCFAGIPTNVFAMNLLWCLPTSATKQTFLGWEICKEDMIILWLNLMQSQIFLVIYMKLYICLICLKCCYSWRVFHFSSSLVPLSNLLATCSFAHILPLSLFCIFKWAIMSNS